MRIHSYAQNKKETTELSWTRGEEGKRENLTLTGRIKRKKNDGIEQAMYLTRIYLKTCHCKLRCNNYRYVTGHNVDAGIVV